MFNYLQNWDTDKNTHKDNSSFGIARMSTQSSHYNTLSKQIYQNLGTPVKLNSKILKQENFDKLAKLFMRRKRRIEVNR